MKLIRFISLILLVVLVGAVQAQDEEAEACDYAALAAQLTEVSEGLEASDDPAVELMALQAEIASFQASCNGLTFTSEEEGLLPVIGPIEIPEGLYRVTVVTDGYFILDVEPLEGECGPRGGYTTNIMGVSRDEAVEGAEALAESTGCEALLVIENVTDPWVLTFEKIR